MGIREYIRTPILLILLVGLPIYFIAISTRIVPETTVPIHVSVITQTTVDITALIAVLMTPLVGALIGGIIGLFVMDSSMKADHYLLHSGFRYYELILARFSVVAAGSLVVTLVSMGIVLTKFEPENLPMFAAAALLGALTYGIIGIMVGVVVSRLVGVYVMLFGPILDIVLFQNPLSTSPKWWVEYLPGHYTTLIALDAGFGSEFEWMNVFRAVAYLSLLIVIASGLLYRSSST